MSRVPANASASCSPRYPSKGCACIQRWSPGCMRLCPMACTIIHFHHDRPGRWAPPIKSPACLSWSNRDGSPPLPDLAGWPRSPHPPGRAGPVLARPALLCSVPWSYRGALFARRSAIRLFRFSHVLCPPHLGRPLPPTSRSDASPALAALPRRPPLLAAIASIERQPNGHSTSGTGLNAAIP